MKYLLVALAVSSLIGCGGKNDIKTEDQAIDCELAGGEMIPYFVENIVTGEQFFYEQCELPKNCKFAICKGNGAGPCPIICGE